jgi:hypothetical protein
LLSYCSYPFCNCSIRASRLRSTNSPYESTLGRISLVVKEVVEDESARGRTGFRHCRMGAGRQLLQAPDHFVDDLSIIAYSQTWESQNPKFQLCDHENDLSYWVGEIPTPERAAELLAEHGEPLDE